MHTIDLIYQICIKRLKGNIWNDEIMDKSFEILLRCFLKIEVEMFSDQTEDIHLEQTRILHLGC